MKGAAEFYAERDQRSVEYGSRLGRDTPPVHLVLGPRAARTVGGQLLFLALLNQLARGFRRISISIPDASVAVLVTTPFPGSSLGEVAMSTTGLIDPFGEFDLNGHAANDCIAVGIGDAEVPTRAIHLWASGMVGGLVESSRDIPENAGTLFGAGIASCLGAAAVWRLAHGLEVNCRRLSLLTLSEGSEGEDQVEMPVLDLGRVLMVGAGAVGNAAAYWMRAFGQKAPWTVVDGDVVELSNTNRGLCMKSADTSWFGGVPRNKADLLATFLGNGAKAKPTWLHEVWGFDFAQYDLILALANGWDVRAAIASSGHPLVLHATTGKAWNSLAHRHISGRDDCIACRMRNQPTLALACATGNLSSTAEGSSNDAALPFLSAAAGLMLVSLLVHLSRGSLDLGGGNRWSFLFEFGRCMDQTARHSCRNLCPGSRSKEVIQAAYTLNRWLQLARE